MMRRDGWVAALLACAHMFPATAWAHAMLVSASPAVGSIVAQAPAELVLRYSEALEARFSDVSVQDASGIRVDQGNPHPGPDGGTSLAIGLKKLPPGSYLVRWRVLSVDTHRTEGSFRFTVAP
jgi:methionine-rich copper-binding protein CopC